MFEPINESALSLRQAAQLFPGQPAEMSVWRWANHGVIRNGQRVHLKCQRIGGRIFTSKSAVNEFLETLNERPEAARA